MKTWIWMMALLMILALPMQGVLAEKTDAAAPYLPTEYAAEYEQAAAALQAHTPGAQVDYAVCERDDGRYEWDLFFTLDGQLGEAEIAESDYTVRRVRQVDMPEGGLTASQANPPSTMSTTMRRRCSAPRPRPAPRLRCSGKAAAASWCPKCRND